MNHRAIASWVLIVAAIPVTSPLAAAEPPVVSFASLLSEMVNREAMARWPDPPFTLKQASSYDRRSKTPGNADWFANVDWSNFIRAEKVKTPSGERTEHVMLDERGPGAIVRVWVGGYTNRGMIRFYIDGADEPVMSGTADELIGGNKVFPEPFAATRARGRNLYAPIPYSKQIKVTYDGPLPAKFGSPGQEGFWYNINYRAYLAGTKVESFSAADLTGAKDKLGSVAKTLTTVPKLPHPEPPIGISLITLDSGHPLPELPPGIVNGKSLPFIDPGKDVIAKLHSRTQAITMLLLDLNAEDYESALRTTLIELEFDGSRTVWCPLGELFGCGVGLNRSRDWWRKVEKGTPLSCHWIMPFRKDCKIRVLNRGTKPVGGELVVATAPWKWDARSLYFHAGFRRDPAIDTSKKSDFNYITVKGRGVYMGDTLSLHNPLPNWWGEGDEKIFVDGEKFPSHFGTGSEDYYGYAWGNTDVFNSPFHSQPRAGAKNQGYTTNSRVRMLDRIPFSKSLQMDMEVWHWRPTKVDYSVATFWYGDADNTSNAQADEKLK